jgi:hypothetical protein
VESINSFMHVAHDKNCLGDWQGYR